MQRQQKQKPTARKPAANRRPVRSEPTAADGALREKPAAPARASSLRKLTPAAQLPTPSILRRFSPEDVALLSKVLSEPMECIYDASFPRSNAAAKYLQPLDTIDEREFPTYGGDPDSPAASSTKTLTAAEERELFLCLNYCRYRAMRLVRDAGSHRLTASQARELVRWSRDTLKTRTHIVQANLSLVPAMAKRSKTTGVDLGDLVCEGNLALIRSVDKFDCMRGFKFSTYACRAILSSFSSSAAKSARYRSCFPTEYDPALEKSDYLERKREEVEDDYVSGLKSVLNKNEAGLSDIEQRVLQARFDLGHSPYDLEPPKAKTLKQVAELIGVTKERVRQIQNKALDKLRGVIDANPLAA